MKKLPPKFSGSVYEAKAGLMGARVTASCQQKDGTRKPIRIEDLPSAKKAEKLLHKTLKTNLFCVDKLDEATQTRLEKSLRTWLDPQFVEQFAVPRDAKWAKDLLKKEFFMCKAPYFSIGFTSYGCMEARYVLGGNLVAVGVSYTAVPGQSLKAKRQALFEMSADDLVDLVKAHGWYM